LSRGTTMTVVRPLPTSFSTPRSVPVSYSRFRLFSLFLPFLVPRSSSDFIRLLTLLLTPSLLRRQLVNHRPFSFRLRRRLPLSSEAAEAVLVALQRRRRAVARAGGRAVKEGEEKAGVEGEWVEAVWGRGKAIGSGKQETGGRRERRRKETRR
jgi:hypothetical protein